MYIMYEGGCYVFDYIFNNVVIKCDDDGVMGVLVGEYLVFDFGFGFVVFGVFVGRDGVGEEVGILISSFFEYFLEGRDVGVVEVCVGDEDVGG